MIFKNKYLKTFLKEKRRQGKETRRMTDLSWKEGFF